MPLYGTHCPTFSMHTSHQRMAFDVNRSFVEKSSEQRASIHIKHHQLC